MVDCWDRDLLPEQYLLAAIVERAILDAQGRFMGFEAKMQRYNQTAREARKWFRDRSMADFGWGWIVDKLSLSSVSVAKLERRAFLLGRY